MSAETPDTHSFHVDVRGVVDLLGRHIYSSPRVYLRELLQNARDAIVARREIDGGGGRIRITPATADDPIFRLQDDGVGLDASDVETLLATVGRTSKRDELGLARTDYLGRFGIGLLSCFMVTDEIVISSRSARGGAPVRWRGSADGTFRVERLSDDLPVGTTVSFVPRPDARELAANPAVFDMADAVARYLPVTITVDLPGNGEESITREPPFLPRAELGARVAYGRELIGQTPLAVIDLSAPETETVGTAYVLPFSPPPGSRQPTRVHLGRMLLSDTCEQVLPDWAFFVRAVVDTTGLSPTASREGLVDDDALAATRERLGEAVRRWVRQLALTDPAALEEFVAVHEQSLKSTIRHDDELAGFITRWLSVETSLGGLRIDELIGRYPLIRYTETVDEFRQVASIADPEVPLVNGGYVYDAELVRRLPELFDGVRVERTDVGDVLDRVDPVPLDDRAGAANLETRATAALQSVGCHVVTRALPHDGLPALYLADAEALRRIDRDRTRRAGGALWGAVMDRIDRRAAPGAAARAGTPRTTAQLCLNWNSPVVRRLHALPDDVFAHAVHLLYVPALLGGHRPLGATDRRLLSDAVTGLLRSATGVDDPHLPASVPEGDPA